MLVHACDQVDILQSFEIDRPMGAYHHDKKPRDISEEGKRKPRPLLSSPNSTKSVADPVEHCGGRQSIRKTREVADVREKYSGLHKEAQCNILA